MAEIVVTYLLRAAEIILLQNSGLNLLFSLGLELPPSGVLMELHVHAPL